jgi:hypothetical protein
MPSEIVFYSLPRELWCSQQRPGSFLTLTDFAAYGYKWSLVTSVNAHSMGDHRSRLFEACGPIGVTRTMARRGTNLFTRNDLRRAIRSAQEMGLSVDSFEIGKDGKIVVHTRKGEATTERNSWDDVVTNAKDPERTT